MNADGSHTFRPSAPQQPDAGTGGGDSDITIGNAVDPTTGCATIAYSGLHNIDLLDNFTTASSPDCGHSFSQPNLYATQNTLTDRQWMTFDGAKTDFLIYHKVDTSQIVVSRSDDGGHTYLTNPDGIAAVGGIIDASTFPKVANESQIGNIVTDYAHAVPGVTYPSGDPAHVLYAIFAGPSSVADNVPDFGLIMGVWALGGLLTLLGALALAEVAVLFPRAGGNYVFLREGYGRWAGFLWGWVEFWIIRSGSIAALAVRRRGPPRVASDALIWIKGRRRVAPTLFKDESGGSPAPADGLLTHEYREGFGGDQHWQSSGCIQIGSVAVSAAGKCYDQRQACHDEGDAHAALSVGCV